MTFNKGDKVRVSTDPYQVGVWPDNPVLGQVAVFDTNGLTDTVCYVEFNGKKVSVYKKGLTLVGPEVETLKAEIESLKRSITVAAGQYEIVTSERDAARRASAIDADALVGFRNRVRETLIETVEDNGWDEDEVNDVLEALDLEPADNGGDWSDYGIGTVAWYLGSVAIKTSDESNASEPVWDITSIGANYASDQASSKDLKRESATLIYES